ncbi:helix-turn-helix domain-containing protein [Nocardia fluminea]|uniref:Helix-turn-helix protein n=1 Tax=Nocardia fluminea TaxID=134984 RepID=A0A2N3WY13_9NOCA|nr:helix-turn-helix domain-containing protein [Nocardia fluminea]PKV98747.1 helix-turn-helix protein [Nocardia fluminea]
MTHFATRLNELFDNPTGPDVRQCTNRQVARMLQAAGHRISAPYLSQLRSGHRDNPSPKTVAALAEYFQVRPDYFFLADHSGIDDHTLIRALELEEPRALLLRAIGLSSEAMDILLTMAERLRLSDRLLAISLDD